MTTLVKVTSIPGTYSKGGRQYGPFQATPEKPYLEVPLGLQMALNLPEYQEPQAKAVAGGTAPDEATQQLLRERAAAIALAESFKNRLDEDTAEWEKQRESLLNDTSAALKREDAAKAELGDPVALVTRLESLSDRLTPELRGRLSGLLGALTPAPTVLVEPANAETPNVPAEGEGQDAPQGTPLPAEIAHRDLLIANGFDTLEKLEAGLILPEGAQESPVRALDGVGQKTEDAYRAAVADWRAQA